MNNDDQYEYTETSSESGDFRITNRKVITLLATALVFLTTYIITGIINNPHTRIDELEILVKSLLKDMQVVEKQLLLIDRDDQECVRINRDQDTLLNSINEWRSAHIASDYKTLTDTQSRLIKLETQMGDCIEHLKNDEPDYYPGYNNMRH